MATYLLIQTQPSATVYQIPLIRFPQTSTTAAALGDHLFTIFANIFLVEEEPYLCSEDVEEEGEKNYTKCLLYVLLIGAILLFNVVLDYHFFLALISSVVDLHGLHAPSAMTCLWTPLSLERTSSTSVNTIASLIHTSTIVLATILDSAFLCLFD